MQEVIDFFKGLFKTDLWPARWHCGQWSSFHGWLYILSDLSIWLAYFMIPIIIINYFNKRKETLKFQRGYFLFAAFILLCGTTHFLDALMFWQPAYRFNAFIRFLTAIASMATVFYLIKILPLVFKQKTIIEFENEILRRQEAEQKLAEVNNGLKAFAYIASHDLQEPLRKISTFTYMLNSANKEKYDSLSHNYSEKITNATKKMQQLIEDVLSLSSIDGDIELEETSIENVIKNAKDAMEIKIHETNAVVENSSIPPVMGNEAYLSQLFTNLLNNSLKFCKTQPIIQIRGQREGNDIVIHFSDNGIGMEESETEKIFEVFHRLNSKKEYEGSGIGLAICKRIIDLHHGKISVISSPDAGTNFIIRLRAA